MTFRFLPEESEKISDDFLKQIKLLTKKNLDHRVNFKEKILISLNGFYVRDAFFSSYKKNFHRNTIKKFVQIDYYENDDIKLYHF